MAAAAPWPPRTAALFLGLAVALLAGLALFYGVWYSVHQDLAGAVLTSRLSAELGVLFADYSMYFPPAERGWFTLATWLSESGGLRLDLAAVLLTGCALLCSTGLAFHIRRRAVGASGLFLVLPCLALAALPILFKNIFGLREHMVVLGLWPYLVLRVSDPDDTRIGPSLRVLVGAWLGTALLLKYFYSIVVLLVEVADATVQRRPLALLRAENLIAGGVVALYLFLWLGVDPNQRAAIGAMLSGIEANLNDPIVNLEQAAMHLSLALVFLAIARIERAPGRATAIGLAMVMAAVAAAWTQGRWYSHHLFPITIAYLAWLWMLRDALKPLWLGALGLIAAWPVVGQFRDTGAFQEDVRKVERVMQRAAPPLAGKRVGLLAMHPSPFNQYLAAAGALRWNATMNNAYVAAELKPFDRPESTGRSDVRAMLDEPGRRLLHAEMLRLWEDLPPDALILDHSTSWPLRHIEIRWTEVFAADPRFRAVLAHYRPAFTHREDGLDFTYYERIDPGPEEGDRAVRRSGPS